MLLFHEPCLCECEPGNQEARPESGLLPSPAFGRRSLKESELIPVSRTHKTSNFHSTAFSYSPFPLSHVSKELKLHRPDAGMWMRVFLAPWSSGQPQSLLPLKTKEIRGKEHLAHQQERQDNISENANVSNQTEFMSLKEIGKSGNTGSAARANQCSWVFQIIASLRPSPGFILPPTLTYVLELTPPSAPLQSNPT